MSLTAFRHACASLLFRFGPRALCVLAAAGVLTACTPTYDWRTVTNNASGYSVDLPAKPAADQRDVDIDGTPMRMRMQTAEVDDVLFVVGTVELPDARPETQQRVIAFLRAGLARNVGLSSDAPGAHDVAVPLAAGGTVEGVEMRLTGKAGTTGESGTSRTIHARLVAKGAHVYEVAIVGRALPPVEQIDQFFGSFKLS
ncbi:hypothetical protein ACFPTO_11790 [Paraburkholderia denitrificans]|uniref:Transmembrane protein n=1 Tax=Paraburkholderia denitrificans TaxID=694025 RepID=A0ABW0J8T7_9BURK